MSLTHCSFGIHDWNKWESYIWTGEATYVSYSVAMSTVNITETRQKRTCKQCGKMQDELVKRG